MRSEKKLLRATAPNQLWQTDITYIWCGIDGWCYCFNVLDTFTRKWLSYIFDVRATKDAAIESIVQAVAQEKPDPSGLLIRSDNGTQYTSKEFRKSIEILGKARVHLASYSRAERSCGIIPQDTQKGIHLATRVYKLSDGRNYTGWCIPGLQQSKNSFICRIHASK